MSPEIISVYTKVWNTGFQVTFLHDSVHCPHCSNGGIHLASLKNNSTNENLDSAEREESSKKKSRRKKRSRSIKKEPHPESIFTKSSLVIKQDSIPQSCFSSLGIKVSAAVLNKLKQKSDLLNSKNKVETNEKNIVYENKSLKGKITKKKLLDLKRQLDLKRHCGKGKRTYDLGSKAFRVAKNKNTLRNELCKKLISRIPIFKVSPRKDIKEHKILKKPNESLKSKIPKEPGLGTLKRKRWQMEKLKKNNVCYEDDLFENKQFRDFKPVMNIEDESDSEEYKEVLTPKISLTPVRAGSSSPNDKDDCYSPNEFLHNRKEAEEYYYRREKRRKLKLQDERGENGDLLENDKNSDEYITKTLKDTCKILEKVALKKSEETDSEEEKDEYFSDVSD